MLGSFRSPWKLRPGSLHRTVSNAEQSIGATAGDRAACW